jgi:hypothetical protein
MPFRQKRRAKAAAGEGVPSAEKARRTGRTAIFIKGKSLFTAQVEGLLWYLQQKDIFPPNR